MTRIVRDRRQVAEVLEEIGENPFKARAYAAAARALESLDEDLATLIAQEAAARAGKVVEINASPHRLDLDWRRCRQAKRLGVKTSVNPDAHSIAGMEDVAYGVDTARRGWLEPEDVVNTRDWEGIRKLLRSA